MRWDERHYDNDIVWIEVEFKHSIKWEKKCEDGSNGTCMKWIKMVLHEIKWRLGNGNVWSGITVALHEISWKEMIKKGLDLRQCYMKGNDNAWLQLR